MPLDLADIFGGGVYPDSGKTAFFYDDRSFSFRTVSGLSDRLGEQFLALFPAGELLALLLPNGPDFIVSYLAAFSTGMVPMPLAYESRIPEISAILSQAKCRHLLVSHADKDRIRPQDLSGTGVHAVWILDDGKLVRFFTLGPSVQSEQSGNTPVPGELALVLHTSGSNGQPKGVMISRSALRHIVQGRIQCADIDSQSSAVVASSLAHSVGLYQVLGFLAAGASFVLLRTYDMDRLVAAINRYQPSHLIMVVGAFEKVLRHPDTGRHGFSNIRFAAVGADRVTEQVQNDYRLLTGRILSVSYGMTELSWILVNNTPDPSRMMALGAPAPGVEVRLVNEAGTEVGRGETGEIIARSPKAMDGYLHDPELTAATVRDGWIVTGDLAYEENGVFWFVGRKKDLIVLNTGDIVAPLELERAIHEIPGVIRCVVVGVRGSHLTGGVNGEVPWAFIQRANDSITREHILENLNQRLSEFKLPRELIFVDAMPEGASGKVSRKEIRRWCLDHPEQPEGNNERPLPPLRQT